MLSLVGSSASRTLRKRVLQNSSCNGASTIIHNVTCFHSSAPKPQQQPQERPAIRRRTHVRSDEAKAKVETIFQKILWLDMVEVHLLTELINHKMGLTLTDRERSALTKEVNRQLDEEMGASTAEDGEEAVAEEQGPKTVDLKLTGYDPKDKIKVIKEVRAITGLGLKDAKEVVEGVPKVISKGLKPEAAEELKAKLEAAGAKVELV